MRTETNSLALLEWRREGHRLGYIAAIARAADESGCAIDFYTTRDVVCSREFETHLADSANIDVHLLRKRADGWIGFAAALSEIGKQKPSGLVVPEVDTVLPVLTALALTHGLPCPTTGIVMRPPVRGRGARPMTRGALKSAWGFAKSAIIRRDQHLPDLELLLLEDPLAQSGDLVWPHRLLTDARRLDDPSDLYQPLPSASLPPELEGLAESRPVVAIMGVIDHRKRIGLALEAWRSCNLGELATLVVAGKQREQPRALLTDPSFTDESIICIDRYLTNDEMGALIQRSKALLLLYDVGTSSGLLTTAAALGRWTVACEGTRTGRIASTNGFGLLAADNPEAVGAAITTAISRFASPAPLALPTRLDFGRRILRNHVPQPCDAT